MDTHKRNPVVAPTLVRWIRNVPWTNFSCGDERKKGDGGEAGEWYGRKRKRSRRNARASEILSGDIHALSHRRPTLK